MPHGFSEYNGQCVCVFIFAKTPKALRHVGRVFFLWINITWQIFLVRKEQSTFCLFTQHWRSCIIGTILPNVTWQVRMIRYWSWQIIGFIPSVLLLQLTFVKVPRAVSITSLPKRYKRQASKPKRVMSPYVFAHSFNSTWMLLVTNHKRRSREFRGRVECFSFGIPPEKIIEWWIGLDRTKLLRVVFLLFSVRITGPSNWKGLI